MLAASSASPMAAHSAARIPVSIHPMTTQAAIGAAPPPGTTNGTPPACTRRRRSCHAARQQAP